MAMRRTAFKDPMAMDDTQGDGGMQALLEAMGLPNAGGLPPMPDPGADMSFVDGDWRYNIPAPNPRDAIAGNNMSPRELFGSGGGGGQGAMAAGSRPTEAAPPQAPQLPQGLTVKPPQDFLMSLPGMGGMGGLDPLSSLKELAAGGLDLPGMPLPSDGASGMNETAEAGASSVPLSPSEPAPAVSNAAGPKRAAAPDYTQSVAPSLLFQEAAGGSGLMGSAGGLFGGGSGITGRRGTGEQEASDLILSLLRMLQR